MNVERHQLEGTADQLLARLEAAQDSDAEAERKAGLFGYLAIAGFIAAFAGIFAMVVPPLGILLLAGGLVSGVVFLVLRSKHKAFDLDDRKLATAVQFLKIIRTDTPVKGHMKLMIDFRDYEIGGRKVSQSSESQGMFSSVTIRKYEHLWLEVIGALADGSKYQATVAERIGLKEKPKRKYTKVKQRVTGAITLKLKVKNQRYGPAEPLARMLQRLDPPQGMAPRAIHGSGQNLLVSVTTDSQVIVKGRYGIEVPQPGHEVTGNSLLSLFLWVYDGVSRGARSRDAA